MQDSYNLHTMAAAGMHGSVLSHVKAKACSVTGINILEPSFLSNNM
jgi:hypothetical protein